jgi:DNA-binding transcriptional ArsR family regulator
MIATDQRVAAIKALAHPTRLAIAEALAEGPRCVSELHALTDADLSTVSKHLSLMRRAGWITCEKRGQHVHYRLACDCLPTFLQCIDSLACDDSDCC